MLISKARCIDAFWLGVYKGDNYRRFKPNLAWLNARRPSGSEIEIREVIRHVD